MARIQGIVGGMSGKMGNAIFRQRNGGTIVSQYQPVVANPNTEGQQVARSKFKLATQLAAIMAPAITIPARRGRNSRNNFVALNYPLIVADPSPEAAERVTIPMEEIQLTDSKTFYGVMNAARTQEGVAINVTITIPARTGNKKGKIALVGYGTLGVVTRPARARIVQVVDVPFDNETTLTYSFEDVDPDEQYTVLSFGMYEVSAGSISLDYDNIHTPAEDGFISAINIEKALSEGAMELTETIGVNIPV